jgi:DNA-binding response OmpR family regulator
MTKVLIVEDDEAILEGLKDDLEFEGFSVSYARDGQDGLDKALTGRFNLIILDILLPKINGFEVCKRLRDSSIATPILMLTAARTEEMDKVRGLELGADDYVTKPFGANELMARVKAILRRTEREGREEKSFSFNDIFVDFKNHEVIKGEKKIHLTFMEFKILSHLIRHRDEVVPRDELLDAVWGDAIVSPRSIEPHIVFLRKKLEKKPAKPKHIQTVRGVGYRFRK